ncbi:unnamed protein product [Sphagnum jensenii]|jgi:hypothetical protein
MQLIFGIGALWGTRNDITGVGPDQFAVLQDNSIDFSFEIKELYSQLGWPIDIARGKGKITGKAKMARVFSALYADLFFGATSVTGETNVSENESYTLAATTLSVANASTFVADLGVYYNAQGNKRFSYVTGALSATGQYSTGSNGAYTFYTGDIGASIAVSYVYTDTGGKSITITNNFMGYTPTFIGTFYQSRATQGGSGQLTLRLNECVSSHLTIPSRIDDYAIPDFDFQAFSAGNNVVGVLSTTE